MRCTPNARRLKRDFGFRRAAVRNRQVRVKSGRFAAGGHQARFLPATLPHIMPRRIAFADEK
jgi:hypothetical protein